MNQSVKVMNLDYELRTVPASGAAVTVAATVVALAASVHAEATHVRLQVQDESVRMTLDGVDPVVATNVGELLVAGDVRVLPRKDALACKLIREGANSAVVYVTSLNN